jgi:hypothetical protein
MADANEFYDYLSNIRKGFSDFGATNSNLVSGTQTYEQKITLTEFILLDACMYLMNKYDPTSQIHMFTADEMRDFMRLINDILDTNYNVDFSQYYA